MKQIVSIFCVGLVQSQNLFNQDQTIIYDCNHNRYLVSNLFSGDIIQIDSLDTQSYFARNTLMDLTMLISGNIVYGTSWEDQRLRGYDLETADQVLNIVVPNTSHALVTAADSSGNILIADEFWKINKIPH
jgi:hypothetical protein